MKALRQALQTFWSQLGLPVRAAGQLPPGTQLPCIVWDMAPAGLPDVLDVTATQEELGKPIGSDAQQGKTTFVTLYGVQGAMEYARKVNDQACAALQGYGERAEFLLTMAQKLIERKK